MFGFDDLPIGLAMCDARRQAFDADSTAAAAAGRTADDNCNDTTLYLYCRGTVDPALGGFGA